MQVTHTPPHRYTLVLLLLSRGLSLDLGVWLLDWALVRGCAARQY